VKNYNKSIAAFLKSVLTIIFILTTVSPVHSESNLDTISDNLYMISGFGGNVAFLVAEETILVVDGGYSPSYGKQILEIIRTVSDKPIEYVVITHYHPDHIRGIQSYPETAKVIAHEKLAGNISTLGQDRLNNDIENRYPEYIADLQEQIDNYEENIETTLAELRTSITDTKEQLAELKTVKLVTPDITFSDSLIIELEGEQVLLHYFGPGHTSGNTIVHFTKQKTIHLGDLFFNDAFPYIDFEAGSNTENWIWILKRVIDWELAAVIPGHGDLADKGSIQKEINYLTDLREAVSQAISAGKTLEESKSEIKLDRYDDYNWPYYLPIGIDAVYKEFTQDGN
jgi:glyoxylase-like metal-dependent hydrolase (beta-lactamase superfamily II)